MSAFPVSYPSSSNGMSLRDYFAAKALPAVIAATSAGQHSIQGKLFSGRSVVDALASEAYDLADAMLRARQNDL